MQTPDGLCRSIWPLSTMPPSARPARRRRSSSHRPTRPRSGPERTRGHAYFAYATNYLIDTDHAIILDVEASRAIRQAEVGASRNGDEHAALVVGCATTKDLAVADFRGEAPSLAAVSCIAEITFGCCPMPR